MPWIIDCQGHQRRLIALVLRDKRRQACEAPQRLPSIERRRRNIRQPPPRQERLTLAGCRLLTGGEREQCFRLLRRRQLLPQGQFQLIDSFFALTVGRQGSPQPQASV